MINNKKRVGSLFLMLVLVLSFSLQTLAATKNPVLTQKLVVESTTDKLFPDLLKLSTGEGLVVDEEKPEATPEPKLDNDSKLDPNLDPETDPETAKLGDSGLEIPAGGPTITPFSIEDFSINGVLGKIVFINESSFTYFRPDRNVVGEYGAPFGYRHTAPGASATPWKYTGDGVTEDTFSIGNNEGIHSITLRAMLQASYTSDPDDWTYDSGIITVLIQRVESYTIVTGLTNPTAIDVGRTDDTYSGDPARPPIYYWEIKKGSEVILFGTNNQPDMDEVNKLSPGDYTVETTATEYFPPLYVGIDEKGDSVTHTTYGNFTVTVGNLTVEHVDEGGNPITGAPTPVTTPGTFKGDDYTTEPAVISGYTLVDDPLNKTGVFTDTDIIVTYVYKKVMTEVKVEHVYEDDGSPVIPHAPTTTGHATIETIQTNQLSQKDITIVDVKVDNTPQGNTSDYLATYPSSGVTTVTYVYKRVMTEVEVRHVYTDGTEVLGHPPVKTSGQVGTEIDTAKLVGETIFEVKLGSTSTGNTDNVKAIFPDSGTNIVTYVYKKPATLVVEHLFFEENGTTPVLADTQKVTQNGFVGDDYTTKPLTKVPVGYILEPFKKSGNIAGKYASGETKVTYSYKKAPAPIAKGTLEVKHIFLDDKGGVVTTPATITRNYTENVGKAYTTTALLTGEIPVGYRLAQSKPPTNPSGSYKTTPTVVEYYYEPIPKVQPGQGTVTTTHTIKHTDGSVTVYETEDPIIDDIGKPYSSSPINIPGYILKEAPLNENGSITAGNQTVTYVYTPDLEQAQLMVEHLILDAAGNVVGKVIDSKATAFPDGTPYTTTAKAPAGYELVAGRAPKNPTGKYIVGQEQVVTYYYAKISDPVNPTPGGTTGSGSWNAGGWSRDRPSKTTVDKSPNLNESKTEEIALPRINNSLEEGNASTDNGDKNAKAAAVNPQTNDTTSQRLVLNIFFAVLVVALVVLVLNSLIPKKSRKR